MLFDDASQPTQSVDFAWDEVEFAPSIRHTELQRLIEARALELAKPMAITMAAESIVTLEKWAWQGFAKDIEGYVDRCLLRSWIFVPSLREYSMTKMAGRLGKKKQSLGRWIEDFKIQFPEVAKGLQHIKGK